MSTSYQFSQAFQRSSSVEGVCSVVMESVECTNFKVMHQSLLLTLETVLRAYKPSPELSHSVQQIRSNSLKPSWNNKSLNISQPLKPLSDNRPISMTTRQKTSADEDRMVRLKAPERASKPTLSSRLFIQTVIFKVKNETWCLKLSLFWSETRLTTSTFT